MHRLLQPFLLWVLLLFAPSMAFVVRHNPIQGKLVDTNYSHRQGSVNLNLSSSNDPLEKLTGNRAKAWQYAKKPLLRIGGKGATKTHGNSLRQLLDQHTVVKVKVNTGPFDGSLESAFDALKQLAVDSGAGDGIELIHIRTSDNTIMFGIEGALDKIDNGDFPPPPPPPKEVKEDE